MSDDDRFMAGPVWVHARQWTSQEQAYDLILWADGTVDYDAYTAGPGDPLTGEDWGRLFVDTPTGQQVEATPRDWLVRGPTGRFVFMSPEEFRAWFPTAEAAASGDGGER